MTSTPRRPPNSGADRDRARDLGMAGAARGDRVFPRCLPLVVKSVTPLIEAPYYMAAYQQVPQTT